MFNAKKMLTKISKQMKAEKRELTSAYIDACSITKSGNVVQLVVYNVKNIPNQTSTLLTIPEGLRPISDVPFDLIQPRGKNASFNYFLRCTARADGRLTVYNYSGAAISGSTNCAGSVTYIVETVGGYCLKAVFSRLCAIVERRWRDAERETGTDKTHAGYVQRCRPIASYQPWESCRSHSNAGRLACCTGGNGQWRVNRANYPSDGWRENCRRANRHHLCWRGGVSVLRGEKGRILHHNHIQVLTNCGVAVLGSYVGGCL